MEEHNKYRARHGVPPLRGDEEVGHGHLLFYEVTLFQAIAIIVIL